MFDIPLVINLFMSRIDLRNIHRKNKVLNLKQVKQPTQSHCVKHINLTEKIF